MQQRSQAGQQVIAGIAQRRGFSTGAVMAMLDAVLRGNGSMAQFNHGEFSGSGQWMRGGMTMVSDMFNNHLKGRVDSLCGELSNLIANQPSLMQTGSVQSQTQGATLAAVAWGVDAGALEGAVAGAPSSPGSLFAPPPPDWWGPSLRYPNSTGAQHGARYAYFAQARRLAVEGDGTVRCTSQYGTVSLVDLHSAGVLTADEFSAKKADLLFRF